MTKRTNSRVFLGVTDVPSRLSLLTTHNAVILKYLAILVRNRTKYEFLSKSTAGAFAALHPFVIKWCPKKGLID